MFTIDPNITAMPLKGKNLYKALFSMNTHNVATPEMGLETARSYVFFFREGNARLSAYIGLYLLHSDRRLFYPYSGNPFPDKEMDAVEEEARNFVEDLGAMIDVLDCANLSQLEKDQWIEAQEVCTHIPAPADMPAETPPAAPQQPQVVTAPAPQTAVAPQQAPAPAPSIPVETQGTPLAAMPVQSPVVQAPVVQAPVVQAPVVQAPVVPAPVVQAPVIQAPVVPVPVVQAPVVQAPAVQAPVVPTPPAQPSAAPPPSQVVQPMEPAEPAVDSPAPTATVETPPAAKRSQPRKTASDPLSEAAEKRRSIIQKAVNAGIIKPPHPASKQDIVSPTGIVSREREALARLLTSF